MRSTRALRAAMIGSAALLLLAPVFANAAPAVDAPSTSLPEDLVVAIERDLGLTPEQYLTKADAGQKLIEFADGLSTQYPDAYAGAWLDPSGTPLIGLTGGDGSDAARAAAESAGYTVRDLPRSERDLEDRLTRAQDWISSLPEPLAGLVGGAVIDVVNNRLVLRVADTAAFAGIVLPDFIDSSSVVAQPALGSLIPGLINNGGAPDNAMFGGDAYAAENSAGAFRCSLGFNAVDSGGETVNVSAGHCDPGRGQGNSQVYEMKSAGTMGPHLGSFSRSNLDGLDYSVIKIDGAQAYRFENNLVRVPGRSPLHINGTANPVVGAPVCKAGVTTGFTCGTINAINQTVGVGNRVLRGGFSANICALQGDSGGTLVTGDRALGISSASNVGDLQFCVLAALVTTLVGDSPQLYATPINAILGANPGLQLRTS